MAEKSIFWSAPTTGDGSAAYTETELFSWLARTLLVDPATQGVHGNYANKLAVSGVASPLTVATGAATVYGIPYENTAAVALAVPTPSVGTTGKRVVLRADFTANTVRIVLITSADGTSAFPALTQDATRATYWEIALANLSVTTGGVITVTDARTFAHFNTMVSSAMLDAGSVNTAALAADSVDDTKAGDRVPQFYRRQGGDPADWAIEGTNNYTPGAVRMQGGIAPLTLPSGGSFGEVTVTFPVPFSSAPFTTAALSFVGMPAGVKSLTLDVFGINPDDLEEIHFRVYPDVPTGSDFALAVTWLAIGPE